MAALPDSLRSMAPPTAAPDLSDYTQFIACPVPEESGARTAYKGFIRPFSDDATARRVFRAIEDGVPLQVDAGRLDVELPEPRSHRLDPHLVDMAEPFTILLLDLPGLERPRTYLLDPPMVPRLSACPHLRTDKSIQIEGQTYPALCVYSGALEKFAAGRSRLEQHLDQTATYLAKYLIWLRTRMLFRPTIYDGREFVFRRRPDEAVTVFDLTHSHDVYWDGYWPGTVAPSGPGQHLATIKRGDECWCWSGKRYAECCRPIDLASSNPHRG